MLQLLISESVTLEILKISKNAKWIRKDLFKLKIYINVKKIFTKRKLMHTNTKWS
jgi:uncharacterized membrane protein SirB2